MTRTTNKPQQDDGGQQPPAVIVLRVPQTVKNKWVRASRARCQKLGDWIVEKVERPMNVFKIPDALADAYHGSGWALAASVGGQLVALRYIRDVAPPAVADAMAEADEAHAAFFVRQWLSTQEAAPTVRKMQALGDVHVGMCSCWEFVEM